MLLKDIKPNEKNPRTISSEKLQKLRKSIKDFPKMFELRPIIIDENNNILGGNMRYKALTELGFTEIPDTWVKQASELTAEEKERFIIEDNVGFGEWDWETLESDWDLEKLAEWGLDVPNFNTADASESKNKLQEKFLIPPMSVFDTRQGYWIDRKRLWLSLGISSELGRDDNLMGAGDKPKYFKTGYDKSAPGTSLFDPVLCELVYTWFANGGSKILDPFAGGSVRGIVANQLGHKYTGVDLSDKQVAANIIQGKEILPGNEPTWVAGDSSKIKELVNDKYNLLFSCPPYADLEVYSDATEDLSNMPYEDFINTYRGIIKDSYDLLDDNSFAVFVVSEVRSKTGNFYNLVGDTIQAFIDAGFNYYNEIILVNQVGTGALRASKTFGSGRKIIRVHQNILVFYKGDTKKIKEYFGEVEVAEMESDDE